MSLCVISVCVVCQWVSVYVSVTVLVRMCDYVKMSVRASVGGFVSVCV